MSQTNGDWMWTETLKVIFFGAKMGITVLTLWGIIEIVKSVA